MRFVVFALTAVWFCTCLGAVPVRSVRWPIWDGSSILAQTERGQDLSLEAGVGYVRSSEYALNVTGKFDYVTTARAQSAVAVLMAHPHPNPQSMLREDVNIYNPFLVLLRDSGAQIINLSWVESLDIPFVLNKAPRSRRYLPAVPTVRIWPLSKGFTLVGLWGAASRSSQMPGSFLIVGPQGPTISLDILPAVSGTFNFSEYEPNLGRVEEAIAETEKTEAITLKIARAIYDDRPNFVARIARKASFVVDVDSDGTRLRNLIGGEEAVQPLPKGSRISLGEVKELAARTQYLADRACQAKLAEVRSKTIPL